MQQQVGDKPYIYIVDDDPTFLTALKRILSIEGYDVAAFDSPAAFLAAHDPARPGCLLLDLMMVEMSSLDVQSRLVADEQKRPVIFITGETSVPTSVMAMKRGALDYLTKPVDPQVLLAAVRDAVQEDARLRSAQAEGESRPVESWETAVTEAGNITMSFMAGAGPAQAAQHHILCDREAAMEIAKDIVRTVALSDVEPDTLGGPPEKRRAELNVFAIRQPRPIF